jgi:hypothetical protein
MKEVRPARSSCQECEISEILGDSGCALIKFIDRATPDTYTLTSTR